MSGLDGQVALVTGASGGIGGAIAEALAEPEQVLAKLPKGEGQRRAFRPLSRFSTA